MLNGIKECLEEQLNRLAFFSSEESELNFRFLIKALIKAGGSPSFQQTMALYLS